MTATASAASSPRMMASAMAELIIGAAAISISPCSSPSGTATGRRNTHIASGAATMVTTTTTASIPGRRA